MRSFRARPADTGHQRADQLRAYLGRELRIARIGSGLTQQALGRLAGVSQEYVSQVERGVVAPSLDVVCRLAAAAAHELSLKLYPTTHVPLRESGQLAMAELITAATDRSWGNANRSADWGWTGARPCRRSAGRGCRDRDRALALDARSAGATRACQARRARAARVAAGALCAGRARYPRHARSHPRARRLLRSRLPRAIACGVERGQAGPRHRRRRDPLRPASAPY